MGLTFSYVTQAALLGGYAFRKHHLGWVRPRFPAGALGRVWRLGSAVMITQSILTVNQFIDKAFASGLEAGSISSIMYANTVLHMGTQLFGLSLVVVMFTRIAELVAEGEMQTCGRYVRTNLNKLLRLVVPGAIALAVAAPEIVAVLFQRGEFDARDAVRTTVAMEFYMYGLPAMAVNRVVGRVFHALQRMRARTWLAVQYLGTNALGNWLLVDRYGVAGLAVASTVAITLHVILSLWVLHLFRVRLGTAAIIRTVATLYLLGGVTVAAYHLLDVDGLLAGIGTGTLAAMTSGILKTLIVFGLYGVLYGLMAVYRRRRASAEAA